MRLDTAIRVMHKYRNNKFPRSTKKARLPHWEMHCYIYLKTGSVFVYLHLPKHINNYEEVKWTPAYFEIDDDEWQIFI